MADIPSPYDTAVRDAALRVAGFEVWLERLRRRMRRAEHVGVEERLVRGAHEALALLDGEEWTEAADRRLRAAYDQAAAAVGLEAPPWH